MTAGGQGEALTSRTALVLVGIGAAVISVTAMFVPLISLGPAAIGAYRCGFAALALALWGLTTSRRAQRPSALAVWASIGAGVCFAGDLWVWHRSILISGTGLATLLANTQVFWVALLSALVLGERLTRRLAVCAAVAALGVVVLAIPRVLESPLHVEGIALGLLTGVFYAGYYLCLRASQRSARRLSVAGNLGISCATAAALLVLAAWLGGEPLPWPEGRDLGLLLVLGVVLHVGGWAAITRGIAHVPAASGSLLLLLQPVLATIWGVLAFAEPFGPLELVGTLLSLVAIYVAMLARAK